MIFSTYKQYSLKELSIFRLMSFCDIQHYILKKFKKDNSIEIDIFLIVC